VAKPVDAAARHYCDDSGRKGYGTTSERAKGRRRRRGGSLAD
jgi:hypothetical protein